MGYGNEPSRELRPVRLFDMNTSGRQIDEPCHHTILGGCETREGVARASLQQATERLVHEAVQRQLEDELWLQDHVSNSLSTAAQRSGRDSRGKFLQCQHKVRRLRP